MSARVHVLDGEDPRNDCESLVWTVLCGEQCFAYEDGELEPPDFDFYLLGHGHEKATCEECKAVLHMPYPRSASTKVPA